MSDIKHPPIDLGLMRDVGLERVVAEEAFQLLTAFGEIYPTYFGNLYAPLPIARADLTGNDNQDVRMRLSALPVFCMDTGSLKPSPDYFVMDMQHGDLPEECEAPEDEDITWRPYLRLIMNCADADDVTIVDSQKYQEVSHEDLVTASFILTLMRHELRGMLFEEDAQNSATMLMSSMLPVEHRGKRRFKSFESTDFLDLGGCADCETDNFPCEHNNNGELN